MCKPDWAEKGVEKCSSLPRIYLVNAAVGGNRNKRALVLPEL